MDVIIVLHASFDKMDALKCELRERIYTLFWCTVGHKINNTVDIFI